MYRGGVSTSLGNIPKNTIFLVLSYSQIGGWGVSPNDYTLTPYHIIMIYLYFMFEVLHV